MVDDRLSCSFIFLDRVSRATERKLWENGVSDWNSFRERERIRGIGTSRKTFYELKIKEFEGLLEEKDHHALAALLPKNEHWRLYHLFSDDCLYVDIETAERYGDITVLGAWDGKQYYCFVKGVNLNKEPIKELFSRHKVFVTFNGSSFDLPIIERYFGGVLPENHIHVDLRHVCGRLGLAGGLKTIERIFDIRREEGIEGFSGADAALLWYEYRVTGEKELLDLLIEYNEADCRNLEPLARRTTALLWEKLRNGIQ